MIVGSSNNEYTKLYTDSNNHIAQYGGNQQDLTDRVDELASAQYIKDLIKRDFGTTDPQAIRSFLTSITCCGCNYTAVVNSVFNQYNGREQDFYNDFGYPMYTVDKNGNIDYNYEYMITEIYSLYRRTSFDFDGDGYYDVYGTGNIWEASNKGADGIDSKGAEFCYNYLKDKYGLSGQYTVFDEGRLLTQDEINSYLAQGKTIILCTNNYNVYQTVPDALYYPGHEAHAMVITGYDENNQLHVSTWGHDYVVDSRQPNPDYGYWTYYEIIG